MLGNDARPLIMDRSTARGITPTRSFVLTIFNYTGHSRVAA